MTLFSVITLAGCSSDSEIPPKEEEAIVVKAKPADPTTTTTTTKPSVDMIGKWVNVSSERVNTKTGAVKSYSASKDFFNFTSSDKVSFNTTYLTAVNNATYQIAEGKIGISFTLYGGSTDSSQVIAIPYVYIFPLEIDKDGLWVVSFSDGYDGQFTFKYKRV